jgi:hypothetical protein
MSCSWDQRASELQNDRWVLDEEVEGSRAGYGKQDHNGCFYKVQVTSVVGRLSVPGSL